jgi:LysR family glycine cleavage system transcriptional activator
MAGRLPPVAAVRGFVLTARLESLRAAAADLGVTPSAVSHQIRKLEEWLQAPVFQRSVRKVRLTALGRVLYEDVGKGLSLLEEALLRARDAGGERHLRVSALPLFTMAWLVPRLREFEERNPGVLIEIDTSMRVMDLDLERFDVAIRNTTKPAPGLSARKLFDLHALPLCTPELARHILTPADLQGAVLIHWAAGARHPWDIWLEGMGLSHLKPRSNLLFDNIPAALEAAAAGAGVVLGLAPVVWDAPAAGRLVVPFTAPRQSAGSFHVVCRQQDRSRPLVRGFVDWIHAKARDDLHRMLRMEKAVMQRRG